MVRVSQTLTRDLELKPLIQVLVNVILFCGKILSLI